MATTTVASEAQPNDRTFGEDTIAEPSPQQVEHPQFNANCEASFKYAFSLAQQVVHDKLAGRAPTEIPTDDAINMAVLVTDMVRMLNASGVSRDVIARAAAYMEGENRLKAGHALRQARSDRRSKPGHRPSAAYKAKDRGNAQDIGSTKDGAQALSGVDANIVVAGNATDGTSDKVLNLDQENEQPKSEQDGKQVDSSTRKPKKKAFWHYRRHYPRKSNDAAAANHKKPEGATADDGAHDSTTVANSNDQRISVRTQQTQTTNDEDKGLSNSHTSIKETQNTSQGDKKPDAITKQHSTSTNAIVDSEAQSEKIKVNKVTPITEVKAESEHVEAIKPETELEQLEEATTV